ncbi:MAG: PAS domain S-box protein [Chloroflexi bacterium]|nr:PAS domain S-box protein [Chloroflexota bacterium]
MKNIMCDINRLISMLKNISEAIITTDGGGAVVFMNSAAERLTGWKFQEAEGRRLDEIFKLVDEKTGEAIENPVERIIHKKTGPGVPDSTILISKDGGKIPVEDSSSPVVDDDGNIIGAVFALRDVTARRKYERALRYEKDLVRQYLGLAGVILVAINNNGEITMINKKGREILCCTDEVIGKNWFDTFIPERMRDEIKTVYRRVIGGDIRDVEYYVNPVVTMNGEEKFIAWHNAILRDESGKMIGTLSSGEDITERKKYLERIYALIGELEKKNEEIEKQRALAEESLKLKSAFLANTSHELRTPLNTILGFLRLIKDGYCDCKEEANEFIDYAYNSASHLLALINDILDLAKIEAGKVKLKRREIDLGKLFEEIENSIRVLIGEKKIKMIFEIEKKGKFELITDRVKLKQILLNLANNAVKFTEEGAVSIKAFPDTTKGELTIDIEDTGIGIPENQLDKIFEPFVQAAGSTGKHSGTGLGLSISAHLAELLGGKLSILKTGKDEGTVVRFVIPLKLKEEEPANEEDSRD